MKGAHAGDFALDATLPPPLPRDGRGAVLTVGTFDGIHRGHRQVLDEIVRRAERSGRRSVLVTFHPHPLRIVRPEAAPALLTTPAEKRELLAQTALEYAVFLPFTPLLRQYSARRFVEEILLGRLGMSELVVGYDHGFGRGREGDVETMREIGAEAGFDVDVVEAVEDGAEAVSSSRIRDALAAGDVREAARGLGRPYSISGSVVRGDGRGRELGFPTANLSVPDPTKLIPRNGIYAVRTIVGGESHPSLLHLGPRPTFADAARTLEVHLLDWSGDLYGMHLQVQFVERLRDVEAYSSPRELSAAMRGDEDAARALFASEPHGVV